MSTILCLDPGTSHTGLAISTDGIFVDPLDTIYEKDFDSLVNKIKPFIEKTNPQKIVIGRPEYGPLVKFGDELKAKLSKFFTGEILLFAEDLSSRYAQSKMKEAGKKYEERRKKEHETAAALILQDYLDSNN